MHRICPVCRRGPSRASDREFGLCRSCFEWINDLWLGRHQLRTVLKGLGFWRGEPSK